MCRRSSAYGKGGFSSTHLHKDPRNIRDKSYQNSCIRDLIKFLAESGYDKPISQKILTAPSVKDFQHIFKFLYSFIDPDYRFEKKFEDEVPLLLKGLRYGDDVGQSNFNANVCLLL